jgi:RNA polymerase sigma factor (sigma-70 family)
LTAYGTIGGEAWGGRTGSRGDREGDASAEDDFASAYRSLFLPAFRVAHRLVGDIHAAEDIAAEALARCYARWSVVNALPYRDAWVMRVATNLALDAVRRRRPARAASERAKVELSRREGRDGGFDDESALRLALGEALSQLPRRQREGIALRYLAGLSDVEVSTALGISASSVRTHVQRGLTTLRATLGPDFREVLVATTD